jgi:hypothetical protein
VEGVEGAAGGFIRSSFSLFFSAATAVVGGGFRSPSRTAALAPNSALRFEAVTVPGFM